MAVTHYTEEDIRSLIRRFEARELPKAEWTHQAHLVAAVWYCTHYDIDEAMDKVRTNISAHNTSVGTPNSDTDGYHETITRFWILVVSSFIRDFGNGSFEQCCNALIDSDLGRSDLPLRYYSPSRLFSVNARHTWVEPDLQALPLSFPDPSFSSK